MHDNGRYVNLESDPAGGSPPSAVPAGPKKFAEPVSVSSTVFADLPLAGTALELGFDLLRFRARRKWQSRWTAPSDQGVKSTQRPQFAKIQLSTFPQQGVQLVDNVQGCLEAIESAPMHLRPPSISHGVISFIWALVFFVYIWFGGIAVGVHGGTSFIFGALIGFLVFLAVMVYGTDEPRGQPRRADRR
jgi:hypothetical protein